MTATLQGKTGRFSLDTIAGIDRQLAKLRRQRDRCYREEAGYTLSLAFAYTTDIDALLDARNAITRSECRVSAGRTDTGR